MRIKEKERYIGMMKWKREKGRVCVCGLKHVWLCVSVCAAVLTAKDGGEV